MGLTMKTSKKLALCLIIACLLLSMVGAVSAERTIRNVKLNGADSVGVLAGESITAEVIVRADDASDANWRSTKYRINTTPATVVCVNTPNHNHAGRFVESFVISAPLANGNYNLRTWIYADDVCSIAQSEPRLLRNSIHVVSTYYPDGDSDGYGDASVFLQDVSAPEGYVADNTDCDDTNAAVKPGVTEVCNNADDNCNGAIDEDLMQPDSNAFGLCSSNTEVCSAGEWLGSEENYLPAEETCDGADNNCNGETDEGVKLIFYFDGDADGFGDEWNVISECSAPEQYTTDNTDCDDNNAGMNPNAEEVCNGIDDNCNGMNDEGETCEYVSYYCDNDGDGYPSSAPSDGCNTFNCVPEECSTEAGTDCNDDNSDISPDISEDCNGIDDNCNEAVDEAQEMVPQGIQPFVAFSPLTQSCYTGDEWTNGMGLCTSGIQTCSEGSWGSCVGEVTPLDETCDGFDNDCDGSADEAENRPMQEIQSFRVFESLTQACYTGPEGTSGVGICASGLQTCSEGGWGSCANEVLPAEEICDSMDNDCDGTTDEGDFSDADADGIKDCVDTDNDNDGVADSDDLIDGDSSDINTNVPGGLVFSVDDVQNKPNHTGMGNVKIANGTGLAFVEFNYDFSNALDLGSINITLSNESGFGSMIIRGVNLSGQNTTKTAYIERIAASDTLCIIDDEVDSIVAEGDCSNGIKLSCPGVNGNYSCELADNNTRYKVSGLKHSAVTEYSYIVPDSALEEIVSLGHTSGILIVVPHNVPKPVEEAPAEESPVEEPAVEEEDVIEEESLPEQPVSGIANARARLGMITGQVVASVKNSPGAWGGGVGIVIAVSLIASIYITTRKANKL